MSAPAPTPTSAPAPPGQSHGFGITIHHQGQNDQNSIYPSPDGGTGDPRKQSIHQEDRNVIINDATRRVSLSEHDIKNNRP
ncbi:unnamed protein product [Rotaria sordida]|uniref:Uncharacterized protein n=1 Tax=Rotaria sordida TaxID=392033 RepID=A0A813XFJ2_9BILA|nr:unnamed protein product [Rotaria sordida]CAF0875368.1 unnamed protein product [Rotaria sordida]